MIPVSLQCGAGLLAGHFVNVAVHALHVHSCFLILGTRFGHCNRVDATNSGCCYSGMLGVVGRWAGVYMQAISLVFTHPLLHHLLKRLWTTDAPLHHGPRAV